MKRKNTKDTETLIRIELDNLLAPLYLDLKENEKERLISAMINYTENNRLRSYSDGYDQGRFDRSIETVYGD